MKTMEKLLALTLGAGLALLAGCAADTSQIQPSYVSPVEYEDYDCDQIEAEAKRVSRKAHEIGARVDKTAADDDAQTAIGIILFWPALFFLEGSTTPDTQAYADLKGKFEALEEASVKMGCDIEFREMSPDATGQTHTEGSE